MKTESNTETKQPKLDRRIWAAIIVSIQIALMVIFGIRFLRLHEPDPIYPGPGVTKQGMLSDYLPNLKGGHGDTPVYHLKGEEPGGKFLVLGGTHPNEISGGLSAITLIENAIVKKGELIVIPRANNSGHTATYEMWGYSEYIEFETENGVREFRTGHRYANWADQFPDPDVYVVPVSGEKYAGTESRNLNRCYPGKERGRLVERIAYGIVELVKSEKVDLVLDMHEAPPEHYIINAMVAHDRAMDLTAMTVMGLYMQGIEEMKIHQSPELYGFSHRSLADATDAYVVLAETAALHFGTFYGKQSMELALEAKNDPFYTILANRDRLYVEYFPEKGYPVKERVGRHLSTVMELSRNLGFIDPTKEMIMENVPEYNELMENGLEMYITPDKN